jgi:hypothetical protein
MTREEREELIEKLAHKIVDDMDMASAMEAAYDSVERGLKDLNDAELEKTRQDFYGE